MNVLQKKRTRNNRESINEIKTLKKKFSEKSKLFNEQINDLKKDSNEKSKQINDLKKDSNEKSKQIKICNEQINDLKKGQKKQQLINQLLMQKIYALEKLTEENNNAFSKLYKEEIKRFLFKS